MPFAIRFHQTGGPEVLRWEEVAVGDPAPGEARVRHEAVGLNFIDTYHRTGLYPMPLPSGRVALSTAASGRVAAIRTTASRQVDASPTTWRSGCASRTLAMPRRTSS